MSHPRYAHPKLPKRRARYGSKHLRVRALRRDRPGWERGFIATMIWPVLAILAKQCDAAVMPQ